MKNYLLFLFLLVNSVSYGQYWSRTPVVGGDGVMEVGKYIDFHESSNDGVDHAIRLNSHNNALLSNGSFIIPGGLYFYNSGDHWDGRPFARLIENWGMRFDSPDPRWVLSSAPSVLVGYRPGGENWGNGSLFVQNNVGIGTTTPDAKLTVAGEIHAQEIKVTTSAGADFVFEDDYILPSLEETEQFIKTNKRLPDIPSAKEMVEDGITLGEMNVKLLQKIEELMLYQIDLNKQVIELKKENEKLMLRMDKNEIK